MTENIGADDFAAHSPSSPNLQVQRNRKRESEVSTKVDPVLAPPVRSQPPIAVPEKKMPQEPARPAPTLAEAAGLKEPAASQELEAAPAPWSSIHPGV